MPVITSDHIPLFTFKGRKSYSPNSRGNYYPEHKGRWKWGRMVPQSWYQRMVPQSCRHSWHLIRLLCVIVNQWCPFSLKIPIWCLPSVCWKGHNAQGVSCSLCLPLLLSWSCAAKSPSTDAASAPFTIRSSSGRGGEEVRQTAAGPVCTKNKWLTDFFFSRVWSVSSGASCWKPQVVQEKLLLPPVPVSTSRQEVSLLGSPCALDKQQRWECNSLS